MEAHDRATTTSVRELLNRDHDRLERLYGELLEAFHADAREDVARLWSALEEGLIAHLTAEEDWVLPAFAAVDEREARRLRSEHDKIRSLLTELGVGVDLHAIRGEVAEAFIDSLRAHARREDALLYRWIDTDLDAASRLPLRRRMSGRATRPLRPV